jgi:hypothetical protein
MSHFFMGEKKMGRVRVGFVLCFLVFISPVFGEMGTPNVIFTPVDLHTSNLLGFSVAIQSPALADSNGALIEIGIKRQGGATFPVGIDEHKVDVYEFDPLWTATFNALNQIDYNRPEYPADILISSGMMEGSVSDSCLTLGIITISTDGLPAGDYWVQVDNIFDEGMSVLFSSSGGPDEPLFGSAPFTVPEPVSLLLFIGAGIWGLRPKKGY